MGFTALAASDIGPGKPVPYTMIENVRNNLDYLYGSLSGDIYTGGLVRNGGMEIDANADGQPDDWTINTYTGGGVDTDHHRYHLGSADTWRKISMHYAAGRGRKWRGVFLERLFPGIVRCSAARFFAGVQYYRPLQQCGGGAVR